MEWNSLLRSWLWQLTCWNIHHTLKEQMCIEGSVWAFVSCFICLSPPTCLSHKAACCLAIFFQKALLFFSKRGLAPPHLTMAIYSFLKKRICILHSLDSLSSSLSSFSALAVAHSFSATLVFLLFFKHTGHAPNSRLCTGCTLSVLLWKATCLFLFLSFIFAQISLSQWDWLWQPYLKQQLCLLYVLLRPLSCSMFFIILCIYYLILCFLFLCTRFNWSSAFPQHLLTQECSWG